MEYSKRASAEELAFLGQRAPAVNVTQLLQSHAFQATISVLLGLAVFLLANWVLEIGGDSRLPPTDATTTPITGQALDSLAPRVPADKVAISTPLFGAQSLLADVQAGDRMDIIALFPPAPNLPARSAVIVRGATVVVRPTVSSGTPIVFAVSPEESLVIAHLVEGGVSLTYSLWPETGAPAVEPTNVANARARLGLDRPTATPTSTAASLPPAENPPPSPPEQAP